MHDFHSVYIQLTRCLFVDQSAANDSSNDESDDDNSEDSDGYDDGVSSSFDKEKLTSEIRNSMVELIAVCGLCRLLNSGRQSANAVLIADLSSCQDGKKLLT